jgi:hypothetical protein
VSVRANPPPIRDRRVSSEAPGDADTGFISISRGPPGKPEAHIRIRGVLLPHRHETGASRRLSTEIVAFSPAIG